MAAATKWKSFIAEFVKSQFSRSKQTPEALPQKRFADIRSCTALAPMRCLPNPRLRPGRRLCRCCKRPVLAPLPLALQGLGMASKDVGRKLAHFDRELKAGQAPMPPHLHCEELN